MPSHIYSDLSLRVNTAAQFVGRKSRTLTRFVICLPQTNPQDKNELNQTLREIREGVNRIEGDNQKTLKCLRSLLAPNYPYPHLVIVEEVKAQGVVGKLRGAFWKDMRLYFLCPVDKRKVPCGDGGEGYRFRQTRHWVKTISPVLQVHAKRLLRPLTGAHVAC